MTMKKKEAQILLDRRLFQAFAGVAPDAVIMLDTKGKILFWNPAAQRIFGYSSDEAIGMDMHRSLAPQRYQEVIKKGFSVFGKTGQGMVVGKTLELAAIHKDGHEFPIELSVAATQLNDEWHAVGIIRDITKRKRKVSIGIATYPKHGTDEASLLAAADKALYRAKESGRDRVCVA